MSTDPAHSLGDVLQRDLGREAEPIGERLWAHQVSAQDELERHWGGVQAWLGSALVARGVDRISAEELTVPPGTDELFSLLQLGDHAASGRFDVVVVDCAPTGETLRLLSFPEVARWWLEKVLPKQGRLLDAARPLARAMLDITLPDEAVLDEVTRLVGNLVAMNELLRDTERVSLRLVMNPDRLVIDEARRTFTYLGLYGYLTDAVIVNRVLPAEVDGSYFAAWRARQQEHLQDVAEAFSPVPQLLAPHFETEVVGEAMLDRLGAALFAACDPAALLHNASPQRLEVTEDGASLHLSLPFAQKDRISLKQAGAELIVRVDGQKRTILLPPRLADYRPSGARFSDGELHVTFERAHG